MLVSDKMAKSLRSKWRRKCRAVKRERYGQKELERLKKTLGIDDTGKVTDVNMTSISDIVTVTDAKSIQQANISMPIEASDDMVVDSNKRVFNSKTLRDQNGTYPIWLHPRKVHKKRRDAKKVKKSKTKKKN